MSSIDEYVEKVKKETQGFSEEEIIRYVYIDLGKRLAFNLKFYLGNSKAKQQVYSHSTRITAEEALDKNIIICKDSSYIIEAILTKLGINVITIVAPNDDRKCAHVYNIVKPKNGKKPYVLDLQVDMENIQAHMRTTEFGKTAGESGRTITRDELEKIDFKIGYVTKEDYYTDEYIDLLRLNAPMFKEFGERMEFILGNIDIMNNKKMGYAERIKHHESTLGKILSLTEQLRLKQIDCYKIHGEEREYVSCITVDVPKKGKEIYLFSIQENKYNRISIEELAKQVEEGLIIMAEIPELKRFMKKRPETPDGTCGR